jgi:hypothetical protein
MKLLQLTKGLKSRISDIDFRWAKTLSWYAQRSGNRFYAATGKSRLFHSFIFTGTWVDHKDGDSLNNTRRNLRPASPTENGRNRIKRAPATSQFKGVSWSKLHDKWRADITLLKGHIFLGCYVSERGAAKAYDTAALRYFGKFARLNFPKSQ